ncbi:MAG: TetR family transcriptional regulator [Acidobacteriota bacterium]|nr:TetR family transcriptional regulator [Acidobacteriota bacterium]
MVQSTIRQRTERASETRGRILNAALQEFSANGLVGARTERIAGSAGVNKALLYYYFESKEKLYLAALEMIADKIRQRSLAVLQQDVSPGERLVRAALDHFDRILAQHEFQSLMQQEMMRHHKGEPGAMPLLVERVFAPLQEIYQATLREGIEMGELIDVDQLQMQLVALGANVFYFLSAPVWRLVRPTEPLAPEVLAQRRVALVEFLGQAVFVDRSHGAEVAARVLGDMPMPEVKADWMKKRGKNERAE